MGLLDFLKNNTTKNQKITEVLQKYGKRAEDINEIRWTLTLVVGKDLARKVTENPALLSEYLQMYSQMAAKDIPHKEIVMELGHIFLEKL
ncbi:MAG: hypothetical protein Q8M71_06275 [Thermodesulfovibrionales bacterium]|nr:hypothetical protein [Thermodesulfovibrionales bacterium]